MYMQNIAFVIGDSHTNTLGLIRSLGEESINFILILVDNTDSANVLKCRYLKKNKYYWVSSYTEVFSILMDNIHLNSEKTIICSNDHAAEFIDAHEEQLVKYYRTPLKGNHIGDLFMKDKQCFLAQECGLVVPKSVIYKRGESIDSLILTYPVLTKPLESINGSKKDIHICKSKEELSYAMSKSSFCDSFIIQEFIDKEYELNLLGVRTDSGITWGGCIQKYRHNPLITGPSAYAKLDSVEAHGIDTKAVECLLDKIDYYGPFSVEFLHKGDQNFFMEVNLRNDGLCYVATSAGLNLPAIYIQNTCKKSTPIKPTVMMNLRLDFKLMLKGHIKPFVWLKQLFQTDCWIDYNKNDKLPFLYTMMKVVTKK